MGLSRYNEDALKTWFSADDVVLVAPLNWGLGHAVRCIPIIRWLTGHCKSVIIASDGAALDFLRKEFPNLPYDILPGYNIRYTYNNIVLNLIMGAYHIISAAIKEHLLLKKIVRKHQISVILSDNRLGMYNTTTKSIYITHQVNLLHPVQWISRTGTRVHRWFISKYDHCLIPDFGGDAALCPALSHGLHTNCTLIGPVTEIKKLNIPQVTDILIILSGPEPQRTILEKLLLINLVVLTEYKIKLIRGTDELLKYDTDNNPHISIINTASRKEVEYYLNSSRLLISRTGYTSVMDVSDLDIKAIWIPTPGQTEQEYLADRLSYSDKYSIVRQNEINNLIKHIKLMI